MTISSTTNRVSYAGNGGTTGFSFPHRFLADADLLVILVDDSTGVETTQTLSTDYTVSGAGAAGGGTVTMTTAPASGETLVIINDPDLTQDADFVDGSALSAESLEDTVDRLTLIAQRTRVLVERAFRLPDGDTSGASLELPAPTALNLVRWNSAGTALESVTVADLDESFAALADNEVMAKLPGASAGGLAIPQNSLVGRFGSDIATLAVSASRLVGRAASGTLKAMTPAEIRTLISSPIVYGYVTATDVGTDQYQVSLGTNLASGEVVRVEFASDNDTITPTLENTSGTPSGAQRLKSREGLEIPVGSLSGIHRVEWDGTDFRVLTIEVEYIGFYNGQASGTYSIGRVRSRDGIRYGRDTPETLPMIDVSLNGGSAKEYDDSILACSPVMVGEEIYLYFEGYDGTRYNIFLAILDAQGRLQRIIDKPVKENTSGDEAHTVRRPRVIHTPGGSPAFQMWYAASATSQDGDVIRYATSPDGFTWTAQGTILNIGTGGSFDDTFLTCDRVLFIDGTYYVFYGGNNGTKWQGGYATSSSPGSGFTKGNGGSPILTSGGTSVGTSADVNDGDTTVTFASGASAFDQDAVVAIWDSGGVANVLNEIKSVDSDTQITLKYPVYGSYTTANSSTVSQINHNSVDPVEVWYDGSTWHCIATVFQFISGRNRESTMYATTDTLDNGFNWQYGVWPLPMNFKRGTWDNNSAENINRIPVRR